MARRQRVSGATLARHERARSTFGTRPGTVRVGTWPSKLLRAPACATAARRRVPVSRRRHRTTYRVIKPAFEDARRRDYMPTLIGRARSWASVPERGRRSPLPSGQSGDGAHRRCRALVLSSPLQEPGNEPRQAERVSQHTPPYVPIVASRAAHCVLAPAKRRVLPVRIRTLWRRLWEVPDVVRSPNRNVHYVVLGWSLNRTRTGGVTLGCGSVLSPRPRQELIAACAEHGRSPYNDKTVKYNAQAATADWKFSGRVAPN